MVLSNHEGGGEPEGERPTAQASRRGSSNVTAEREGRDSPTDATDVRWLAGLVAAEGVARLWGMLSGCAVSPVPVPQPAHLRPLLRAPSSGGQGALSAAVESGERARRQRPDAD